VGEAMSRFRRRSAARQQQDADVAEGAAALDSSVAPVVLPARDTRVNALRQQCSTDAERGVVDAALLLSNGLTDDMFLKARHPRAAMEGVYILNGARYRQPAACKGGDVGNLLAYFGQTTDALNRHRTHQQADRDEKHTPLSQLFVLLESERGVELTDEMSNPTATRA
jgi:hypothetical protein